MSWQYTTPWWRRRREALLRERPLCQRCQRRAAQVAHHEPPLDRDTQTDRAAFRAASTDERLLAL